MLRAGKSGQYAGCCSRDLENVAFEVSYLVETIRHPMITVHAFIDLYGSYPIVDHNKTVKKEEPIFQHKIWQGTGSTGH